MSKMRVTCPVCNGTGRKDASGNAYKTMYPDYDAVTDTLPCTNCGGQYMYGKPTGEVNAKEDGTGCVHEYRGKTIGRCLTAYTCKNCDDYYTVDSGD